MNAYWSMTSIRFCMRRIPPIRKFWLFTLKVWVTYSSWMVCKVSFFLFLMCTCFISVPLFLSFSDLLTSHKSEMSGQQSLRVVSWLIKELRLNMKLWILCWFLPWHFFELKPGVSVVLRTVWIHMLILIIPGGLW